VLRGIEEGLQGFEERNQENHSDGKKDSKKFASEHWRSGFCFQGGEIKKRARS